MPVDIKTVSNEQELYAFLKELEGGAFAISDYMPPNEPNLKPVKTKKSHRSLSPKERKMKGKPSKVKSESIRRSKSSTRSKSSKRSRSSKNNKEKRPRKSRSKHRKTSSKSSRDTSKKKLFKSGESKDRKNSKASEKERIGRKNSKKRQKPSETKQRAFSRGSKRGKRRKEGKSSEKSTSTRSSKKSKASKGHEKRTPKKTTDLPPLPPPPWWEGKEQKIQTYILFTARTDERGIVLHKLSSDAENAIASYLARLSPRRKTCIIRVRLLPSMYGVGSSLNDCQLFRVYDIPLLVRWRGPQRLSRTECLDGRLLRLFFENDDHDPTKFISDTDSFLGSLLNLIEERKVLITGEETKSEPGKYKVIKTGSDRKSSKGSKKGSSRKNSRYSSKSKGSRQSKRKKRSKKITNRSSSKEERTRNSSEKTSKKKTKGKKK